MNTVNPPTNAQSPLINNNIHIIEFTKTFNHNIDRVFYIIREASIITSLIPDKTCPLILKHGNNSWTIGSIFISKTNLFGEYNGRCVKSYNYPQKKKIAWEISVNNIPKVILSYNLYKITVKDSTALMLKVKILNEETYTKYITHKNTLNNFWNTFIMKVNIILSDTNLNLFSFEACVINSTMEKIWNLVCNLSNLKKIAPSISLDCEDANISLDVSPETEITISSNNHKHTLNVKVIKIDKKNTWNKWRLSFEIKGVSNIIPTQVVFITVVKINENECQLAVFHNFKEASSKEYLQTLQDEKKYILYSIKDYLENYC